MDPASGKRIAESDLYASSCELWVPVDGMGERGKSGATLFDSPSAFYYKYLQQELFACFRPETYLDQSNSYYSSKWKGSGVLYDDLRTEHCWRGASHPQPGGTCMVIVALGLFLQLVIVW